MHPVANGVDTRAPAQYATSLTNWRGTRQPDPRTACAMPSWSPSPRKGRCGPHPAGRSWHCPAGLRSCDNPNEGGPIRWPR